MLIVFGALPRHTGWWRFCNLPSGITTNEWLNGGQGHEQLIDPNMNIREVETVLLEQTFDDWLQSDLWEIESHTRNSVDELIRYWNNERVEGEGYYGDENEHDRE